MNAPVEPKPKKGRGRWIALLFVFWGVLPLTGMMIYLAKTSPRWKNARSGLPQLIVRTFGEKEPNVTITWRRDVAWAAPRSLVALVLNEASLRLSPIRPEATRDTPDPARDLLRAELPETPLDLAARTEAADLARILPALKAAAGAMIERMKATPSKNRERDRSDMADLARLAAQIP